MDFIKSLTPLDTEEVKPGLFIQKKGKGYRQIHPAAWDGKMNWKNFILGPNSFKHFLFFVIIMFLAFSYWHDTKELKEFYYKVNNNKISWCAGMDLNDLDIIRGDELNEQEYTITISDNNG